MNSGSRRIVAFCLLAAAAGATSSVRAAEAPTCRDLERRFETIKADATPAQLSLALFPASPMKSALEQVVAFCLERSH